VPLRSVPVPLRSVLKFKTLKSKMQFEFLEAFVRQIFDRPAAYVDNIPKKKL
jgi:hypothetical protein